MRRANGTGSVYKRSDSSQRRNPWVAVLNLGYDESGKRRRKIIARCRTKKEAQLALEKYTYDPTAYAAASTTFGQVWEAVTARKAAQGKLDSHYVSAWNMFFKPLERVPIADVKTMHLQKIFDLADVGVVRKRQLLTVLHWIYETAMANDIISKDYSRFIELPKLEKSTKHHPFSSLELQRLWEHTDNAGVKIALILTYTGMRRAELTEMLMENVHLDERYMVGGVKTEASKNRIIPIADCILPFVRYFYHNSQFKRSKYLITPSRDIGLRSFHGLLHVPPIYDKTLPEVCGVKYHTPHDSRHTFVTMASNYGIPDVVSRRIVGHVSGGDVHDTVYTHKSLPQFLAAVNKLPFGADTFLSPEEKDEFIKGRQLEAT